MALRLALFSLFLSLAGCNLLNSGSLLPDMEIECNEPQCSDALSNKTVYFGVTTNISIDCDEDLLDLENYDDFKAFFKAYTTQKTIWRSKKLVLRQKASNWNGQIGGGIFDTIKPAVVCAFVDSNNDKKWNAGEPLSQEPVDLGFAEQRLTSWRNPK